MNARFILTSVLLLITLIVLTQFTFEKITGSPWHWALHFLYGWLFVAALAGYALVESKMRSKAKDFINVFMLTSGMRMFASVLIIVFMVLKFPQSGKYISVYYVVGYLSFLIIEVIFLFRRSKEIK